MAESLPRDDLTMPDTCATWFKRCNKSRTDDYYFLVINRPPVSYPNYARVKGRIVNPYLGVTTAPTNCTYFRIWLPNLRTYEQLVHR